MAAPRAITLMGSLLVLCVAPALSATAEVVNATVLHQYAKLTDPRFNNLTVFYRTSGKPTSSVLLMLHGFPSSSHEYARIIPILAEKYYVVAPDFPGFGLSDQPPQSEFNYTFDKLTNVTQAFVDQLGLNSYILYVHDYGGPVGFKMAVAQPSRVRGLIVQNANAYAGGLGPGFDSIIDYWNQPTNATAEAAARTLFTLPVTEGVVYKQGARNPITIPPEAWIYDQYFLDRPGNADVQLALFRDYQNNVKAYPYFNDYFRTYTPPTLVVWGKNDPFFTVQAAYDFQKDIPNATVVLYNTSHQALEEDGYAIAQEILNFKFA